MMKCQTCKLEYSTLKREDTCGKCRDKYKNHFCKGQKVWMKICAECKRKKKRRLDEQ